VQHRTELNAAIEDVFRELSEADVTARLDTAQIASARINSIRDLIDHPQLRARDAWREVGSPVGPIPALMPPVRMAAVSVRMDEIPALGQHSVAILKELGFDADRIDVWKSEGLI
jgi:crotonobetainyl-CoA:carnitine CoA-transferase CaiB-like acyl-CoA transferase